MDPFTGGSASPTRRKMRSKSGSGSTKQQQQHSPDPVLALMMTELTQRQSWSASGGTTAAANSKHFSSNAPLPMTVDIASQHNNTQHSPYHPQGSSNGRGCCSSLWQRLWFRILVVLLVLTAVVLAIALPVALSRKAAAARQRQPPQYALGPRLNTSQMTLVFADDFTSFDGSIWNTEVGDGADYGLQSWGNNELQCYTNSPNNIDIMPHPDFPDDDGVLRIRPVYSATPQACVNLRAPNSTRQWTSGKIETKNRIAFTWSGQQVYRGPWSATRSLAASQQQSATQQPGAPNRRRTLLAEPSGSGSNTTTTTTTTSDSSKATSLTNSSSDPQCPGVIVVESRMKFPVAAGRWSALWMMPRPVPCPAGYSAEAECGALGGWPRSGEIDIVEQVNTAAEVLGVIHYADRFGNHQYQGGTNNLSQEALLGWNILQIVWDCSSITWYVNAEQFYRVNKGELRGGATWPFDEPFFLIINTAVGGWLTGNVSPDQGASQPFLVDYVRVYAQRLA